MKKFNWFQGTCFFLLAFFNSPETISWAQEKANVSKPPVVETLEARVLGIDWVASTMVLQWYEPENAYRHDEVFQVPQDCKVTINDDSAEFADLEPEDKITVEYYVDKSKNPAGDKVILNIFSVD